MAQLGNPVNRAIPTVPGPVVPNESGATPSVAVEQPAPVRKIDGEVLRILGAKYRGLFDRFASERIPAEQKWLKNLRQYLGVYDPELEQVLPPNRSRAYPRITRVKCISMLSRLMNLMFPGNEKNWELSASPSPEMSPEAVAKAVNDMLADMQASGQQVQLTDELIEAAITKMAAEQAEELSELIDDQLTELGGDQTLDWVALNRKVIESGIKYGVGVLEGPYIRTVQQSGWMMKAEPTTNPDGSVSPASFQPVTRDIYKPHYEHLPVWDFYPDMSARRLPGEGYFVRKVLGRSKFRKLADRPDFFADKIKEVIKLTPGGNYKMRSFENDLRAIGLSIHAESTSAQSNGREKFEIIIWKGPISAQTLRDAGADVPDSMLADDVEAELWMVDSTVIKAAVNAWALLGADVKQIHTFEFDEDDTSPIGQGLPGIVRDSQLSVCAATRMVLDNASVTCGPNLEVNTRLLRMDQDLTNVQPYKLWYRDDDGPSSQFPAVRPVAIEGHIAELEGLVKMFLEFAEMETFIGGATGGDMQNMPSEPMRTAAGASMIRGDAALPFKDVVRNYDTFTQSVIWSLVGFNKKYNPDIAPEGDYDVIPRGATSLIAKEVRGAQIDILNQTLSPDDWDHVDRRAFIEARFASRDLQGMLVSEDQAKMNQAARAQQAQQVQDLQTRTAEAAIKKTAAEAFKNITQGQKNSSASVAAEVKTAMDMISTGENNGNEPPKP